jgi:hypothetical protein
MHRAVLLQCGVQSKILGERKDVQGVEKHSALYIEQRMYGFRR